MVGGDELTKDQKLGVIRQTVRRDKRPWHTGLTEDQCVDALYEAVETGRSVSDVLKSKGWG